MSCRLGSADNDTTRWPLFPTTPLNVFVGLDFKSNLSDANHASYFPEAIQQVKGEKYIYHDDPMAILKAILP